MHTSFTSVYKFKIVHASYARSLQVAVEDGQAAGNCMVLSTHIHRNGLCIAIHRLPSLSFRWFIVAESTVRWLVVREKHCWMAADSAE
jgi:hypothetical protein